METPRVHRRNLLASWRIVVLELNLGFLAPEAIVCR